MPEGRLERTRKAYDWKTIPSTVTADEAEAFNLECALRDKRSQSYEAVEKFMQDFMK